MCGITGIANVDVAATPSRELLARMCAALTHRGPDAEGGYVAPGVGLAMRRLAVIDLPHGHQPMFSEDGSIAVVFNGEIYNFPSLRKQLISQGHQFHTSSDTETIVHLYEQEGLDFAQHLHGMFAIALWDTNQQQLVLVRDRLGVKPLYYHQDAQRLRFASELKALLQDPNVPRQVDTEALHDLLTWGHILPPRTIFRGLTELPPAHMLLWRRGQLTVRRYWQLPHEAGAASHSDDEVLEQLDAHLEGAVKRRLTSDVPLGAFLSGGIDSSLVVAYLSRLSPAPVPTFSVGFEDQDFSELRFAADIARHFGTEHHERIIQPDVVGDLDRLVFHHDAPFYDSSAIPTFYLSEFASEHVKVALSGDGGDELFAGYNIFLAHYAAESFQRLPGFARQLTRALLNRIPESGGYWNRGRIAREFASAAELDPLARYARWATKIKSESRQALYADPRLQSALKRSDVESLLPIANSVPDSRPLQRLLHVATLTELPADMLRKVDRMSMAHSLEVRSPLLDHMLFEFAARLEPRHKIRGWTTKFALRNLARRVLPPAVVRRPKRGFSIPLDRWLREDLKEYAGDVLLSATARARPWFHHHRVAEFYHEHQQGQQSRGRELWTMLTFELWQRAYIDDFRYQVADPQPLTLRTPQQTRQESQP